MKNFHICDIFFKHIVDVQVVALIIETIDYTDIDKL